MKLIIPICAFLFLCISGINAQIIVNTTNTSSPNACDGSACLDSNAIANINATSIYWSGGGAVIQQGGYCVYNLCAGTYTVTYAIDSSNVTNTFVISNGTTDPCFGFMAVMSTQAAQDASSCDGTATVTATGGTAPYTFSWSIGATTSTVGNLCDGTDLCCYVTDANGCVYTACDSISASNGGNSGGGGDTLIINSSGNGCNTTIGSVTISFEDCNIDYNAIDTAFLSNVVNGGANVPDSSMLLWVLVDTNGVATTITTFAPPFSANGCYDLTLVVFCSGKSSDVKTIVVNAVYEHQSAGLDILQSTNKKLLKVVDMTGREVDLENAHGILIYLYEDGTSEKVFVSEN